MSGGSLGRCAVVGGSGWLGSFIVSQLSQRGYQVLVLDVAPLPDDSDDPLLKEARPMDKDSLVSHVRCDITDESSVLKVFQQANPPINSVFLPCCITDIRLCPSPLLEKVNIEGCKNIILACLSNSVSRLVYTSTIDAIHNFNREFIECDENEHSLDFTTNSTEYGRTKAIAEQMVLDSNQENNNHDFQTTVIRVSHLYGIGDPLIDACNEFLFVIDDTMQMKHSFNNVKNAANAHILAALDMAAENIECSRMSGRTFWIKDYDSNYLDFYRNTLCGLSLTSENIINLPLWFIYGLACVYDALIWLVFTMFGLRIGHPVKCFGRYAISSVTTMNTVSDASIRSIIGDYRLVSNSEGFSETLRWYQQRPQPKKKQLLEFLGL